MVGNNKSYIWIFVWLCLTIVAVPGCQYKSTIAVPISSNYPTTTTTSINDTSSVVDVIEFSHDSGKVQSSNLSAKAIRSFFAGKQKARIKVRQVSNRSEPYPTVVAITDNSTVYYVGNGVGSYDILWDGTDQNTAKLVKSGIYRILLVNNGAMDAKRLRSYALSSLIANAITVGYANVRRPIKYIAIVINLPTTFKDPVLNATLKFNAIQKAILAKFKSDKDPPTIGLLVVQSEIWDVNFYPDIVLNMNVKDDEGGYDSPGRRQNGTQSEIGVRNIYKRILISLTSNGNASPQLATYKLMVRGVATTIAHETGHLLGIINDREGYTASTNIPPENSIWTQGTPSAAESTLTAEDIRQLRLNHYEDYLTIAN